MRLVIKENKYIYIYSRRPSVRDISDAGSTLGKILYRGKKPSPFEQVLTLIL